jgi:hypothetical protein
LVFSTFLEQQSEGPFDDHAGITVRDLAAEQGLKASKPLMAFRSDGELYPIPLRRRGPDDRTGCGSQRGGRVRPR